MTAFTILRALFVLCLCLYPISNAQEAGEAPAEVASLEIEQYPKAIVGTWKLLDPETGKDVGVTLSLWKDGELRFSGVGAPRKPDVSWEAYGFWRLHGLAFEHIIGKSDIAEMPEGLRPIMSVLIEGDRLSFTEQTGMMMSFSKEEKMESKPAGMAPVKMLDKPQKFSCYQFSIQSKRKLYSETSPDAEPDYGADEGMIYNFDLSIETDLKSTQVAEGVSLDDVSKSFEELVEDWKKAKYALPAVAFSEKLFNTKDGVGEIRKLGPGGAYNMHEINFSTQYGVIHLEHDGSLTNEEACALIKSFRLIERR